MDTNTFKNLSEELVSSMEVLDVPRMAAEITEVWQGEYDIEVTLYDEVDWGYESMKGLVRIMDGQIKDMPEFIKNIKGSETLIRSILAFKKLLPSTRSLRINVNGNQVEIF